MNKKGVNMIKLIFFLIMSLIVGAIVIGGFLSMTNRALKNTAEEITAKDIGLTIMTISAAPYDVIYGYDKNTEEYNILVSEGKVMVESKEGKGVYEYFPMPGVKVEDADLVHPPMIPFSLKKGKLSFSDSDVDYSDACGEIPQTFDDNKIRVKIIVDSSDSQIYAELKKIKDVMATFSGLDSNSPVEFVEYREDVIIELSTATDAELKIFYYEYDDPQDESYFWYKRLACYSGKGLEDAQLGLGDSALYASTDKKIRIEIGKTEEFAKKSQESTQLTSAVSRQLYDAIKKGITS